MNDPISAAIRRRNLGAAIEHLLITAGITTVPICEHPDAHAHSRFGSIICRSTRSKREILATLTPEHQEHLRQEAMTYGADAVYGDLDAHDKIEVDLHWANRPTSLTDWAKNTAGRVPAGYEPVRIITPADLHQQYLAHELVR